jgi:glycosyltransferase involved in cell wall biosynthesis
MRAPALRRGAETLAAPRIGFLLGKPTQFEAPFFRHAQAAGKGTLEVLYLAADGASAFYDPELGRHVDWGIDLFSGYPYGALPAHGQLRWLLATLRADRFDWLVINGYTAPVYLMALAIARLRGIRTALRIDSVLFNAAGWRRRTTKRAAITLLARCFDRFFATGSLAREYLVHFGVEPRRISLFPYVVDADRLALETRKLGAARASIRARFGVPTAARVVLAVAKMNAREAPWDLLGALEGLDQADLWTVLVGDGEQLDALRRRVEAHALKRIVFAGYVPYAELVRCYAMADVFVHAAANEPWGVSVHEAIACGLPVVASSRVGAARDLVLEGRNGFIYAAGDAADLRATLAATIDGLDPEAVARANREVLARWNYARTWDGILEACA